MSDEITEYPIKDTIQLARGGDYHETHNFFQDDGVTVEDTTGWKMHLYIMSAHQNGETYATLSTDTGEIVNTPASGQFNINFTQAMIDAYDFTSAVYRIVIEDGTDKIAYVKGDIKVV